MTTLQLTEAGTIALEGLDAYREGNMAAAQDAARRARVVSGSAFAGQYIDGLAYAVVLRQPVPAAERAVRRFLIALDDPRYTDLPGEVPAAAFADVSTAR